MSHGPRRAVVSIFLRSFLVQGAWNYHTMLGTGFAFALLPGLRRTFEGSPEKYDEAVRRHLEHFNAHPYLAGVALGAVHRLEREGADAETIRRFKTAVRGPLGSLGDRLVWATWLPLVAMASLVLYWLGVPPAVAVGFFVVVYNVGHVGLRVWGLRVGLEGGRDVARRLADADLGVVATRLQVPAVVLVGALAGVLMGGPLGAAGAGRLWIGLGVVTFVAGLVAGHRAWRPAAVGAVLVVAVITMLGVAG